ncbi:MAG: pilus assembly protein N-terminal domain-containing protein [Bauldia sp.]
MLRGFAQDERLSIIRTLTGIAVVVAGIFLARAAAHAAEPISIYIDRAKVMRISRPAETVIIGNPAIADATIQDNQMLIITGRSYGTTNLIVLDSSGQPIADEILTVQAADDSLVTVFKRDDRQTLSCNPDCGPTLAIGDDAKSFSSVKGQISDHQSISSGQ